MYWLPILWGILHTLDRGNELAIQEEIKRIIEESLIIVSSISSDPRPFAADFDGTLIGVNGLLDSLETVTLLINIEEKINATLSKQIGITASIFERLNTSITKSQLHDLLLEIVQDF
jgi:acyl carrier protein